MLHASFKTKAKFNIKGNSYPATKTLYLQVY